MHQHFGDPILSRIQSSVELQLRRQGIGSNGEGNTNTQLARQQHMKNLTRVCQELQRKRHSPFRKFRVRPLPAEHLGDDCRCMELYTRLVLCRLYGDQKKYGALKQEYEFSDCDTAWIQAVEEYFEHFGMEPGSDPIPYVDYHSMSDYVTSGIPNTLTIGILGDWGTGMDIAVDVLQQVVDQSPDLIIHLGDVYYSGTLPEYEAKLIELVDRYAVKSDGTPIPFLNMAGNHDMYAGGEAYYHAFDHLNARLQGNAALQVEQHASYFCLRLQNQSWQILGFDTSYHDHNPFMVDSGMTHVRKRERDWLIDKVTGFPGQTVLLSHHQPFSPFERIGLTSLKRPSDFYTNPHLMKLHDELREASSDRVPLWIWGHEHNLALYRPFREIERGRCVGHSAVPVLNHHDPYAVRECEWRDVLGGLIALITGRWGLSMNMETQDFLKLISGKAGRVDSMTPKLMDNSGEPIALKLTEDGNMYRHGFAIMKFVEHKGSSDLTVAYFDDVDDSPLLTESLSGSAG